MSFQRESRHCSGLPVATNKGLTHRGNLGRCGSYNVRMKDDVNAALPPVRFVLVEPTHPGNIGGSARAIKTMGFEQLRLVKPRRFPSGEATAMAAGADDVLEQASLLGSFAEAVADCSLVIGASARLRHMKWPSLSPAAAAEKLLEFAARGPVAIAFGRESSGLSNEEMDLCHYLVHIPCNSQFSSLNLVSAVQVIAYEIRKCALPDEVSAVLNAGVCDDGPDAPASSDEVEGFYEHLERTLRTTRFFADRQSQSLMRRLRKLFNRTHLSQREVNILRGILSAFGRELRSDDHDKDPRLP